MEHPRFLQQLFAIGCHFPLQGGNDAGQARFAQQIGFLLPAELREGDEAEFTHPKGEKTTAEN